MVDLQMLKVTQTKEMIRRTMLLIQDSVKILIIDREWQA